MMRMKLPNVLKPQIKTEFLNNNPLSNNSSIILFILCLIKYVTYFIFVINELYEKLWQCEKRNTIVIFLRKNVCETLHLKKYCLFHSI